MTSSELPPLPEWFDVERQLLRVPEALSVADWADRHFKLPPTSPRPEWLTAWTEYLREPLETLLVPGVREVTMMTGAQVGKTSVLLILLCFIPCERPRPMLYVMPREDDHHMIHGKRIKPAIDASPRVAEELTGRGDDVSLHGIGFARCDLFYASAKSPPSLKSKPIAVVLVDEADEMHDTAEGCPISMAGKRTTNYADAKRYVVSTPTYRTGKIFQRWEQSDQRRFWVPCSDCGVYQVLEWESVRWSEEGSAEERADTAALWCKECGVEITDADRRAMIRRGVWVPEGAHVNSGGEVVGANPRRGKHRGYHLPSLYSPFVTIEQLVFEFLTEDSADFIRQRLAWIFEDQVDTVSRDQIAQCRTDYVYRQVPDEAVLLTAGIDVQGKRLGFFYVIRAWAEDGSSWLIRAANPRNWATLEEDVVCGEYARADGTKLPVAWTFVDSGGSKGETEGRSRTDEVYDFCRGLAHYCAPTKGRDMLRGGAPFIVTTIDKSGMSGKKMAGGLKLWSVNTLFFKDWLAGLISGERAPWRFPDHDGDLGDYESHLRSEHKVERHGKQYWLKKPGKVRNDYWDCEVLALAAWHKSQGNAGPAPQRRRAGNKIGRSALGSGPELGSTDNRRGRGWLGMGRRRR